jgi:4a-hydroxytetrahydrobiopterin dehydratase
MTTALTPSEIQNLLQTTPGWILNQDKLTREWIFEDFIQAMIFVNRIAEVAESAGHHPDIDIRYNRVLLGLISHDANGITQRDAAMAARINQIFPSR